MKVGKFVHVAPREIEGGYYLKDIYRLRDNTEIGDSIGFWSDRYFRTEASGYQGEKRVVRGKIAAKYPHVFMLEDGSTYSWVDYMLGRQK